MKYIVVQWLPENKKWGYGKAMRVIKSNHPRFQDGTRFDFGFLEIASCEGYVITVLPSAKILKEARDILKPTH
jgi:hypothetical protein